MFSSNSLWSGHLRETEITVLMFRFFNEKVYSLITLQIKTAVKSLLLFTIKSQQTNGKVKRGYLLLRKKKKKKNMLD